MILYTELLCSTTNTSKAKRLDQDIARDKNSQ